MPDSTIRNRASRLKPAQQGQDDALAVIVELLVDEGCLDVVPLVCLGRCSKALKAAAAEVLERRAMFLLPTAVQQAAADEQSSNSSIKEKSARAVRWILQGGACGRFDLSRLTAPTAAAQFISVSNVPREVASALLQAGVRFSYEQFMQAVRSRTAGVEVWMTATAGLPMMWAKRVEAAKRDSSFSWIKKLCNKKLVSRIIFTNATVANHGSKPAQTNSLVHSAVRSMMISHSLHRRYVCNHTNIWMYWSQLCVFLSAASYLRAAVCLIA
jgi:hypothetical protein